jgi:hypothetical protein
MSIVLVSIRLPTLQAISGLFHFIKRIPAAVLEINHLHRSHQRIHVLNSAGHLLLSDHWSDSPQNRF